MMGAAYPNVAAAIGTILQEEGVQALFNGGRGGGGRRPARYAYGKASSSERGTALCFYRCCWAGPALRGCKAFGG